MLLKQTAPDSGLQRLLDEGYEVEVRNQHLLVHSIPYVTQHKEVKRGTIVCLFTENAGIILPPLNPPDTHQVWWTGEYPCFASGNPIENIRNEDNEMELFAECKIKHRFSNKPDGVNGFTDHYLKVTHYISLLEHQARVIEPNVTARTGIASKKIEEQSVFRYPDSASARAEIMMTSAKLAIGKVAIIGIGGTGAYILDQVTKTHTKEIHLYDGDEFLQHNAFRAPGAASKEAIQARQLKVDYFQNMYEPMRIGIHAHPYYLDEENISELDGFNFVFVCVDNGKARKLICRYLQSKSIPFIDVGMNLIMMPCTLKLRGSCRYTLSTPSQNSHIEEYIPMDSDDVDILYRQNIQVADMNALNAVLAVIKWKQYFGFYDDAFTPYHGVFSIASTSLVRTNGIQSEMEKHEAE